MPDSVTTVLTRLLHVIVVWARDAVGKSWTKKNEAPNVRRTGLGTIRRSSRMGARAADAAAGYRLRATGERKPEAGSQLRRQATQSHHRPASARVPVDAIRLIATDRTGDRSASSVDAIPRSPRTPCGTGTRTEGSSATGQRS